MAEAYPVPSDVDSVSSSDNEECWLDAACAPRLDKAAEGRKTENKGKDRLITGNYSDWNSEEDDDEDAEEEQVQIKSFFDDAIYSNVKDMVSAMESQFGFDFLAVRDRLGLDFYGCVRLINFVRRHVRDGGNNTNIPDPITAEHLADDQLLIPVLENDELIFCLDDLPASPEQANKAGTATQADVDELLRKNSELQDQLDRLAQQFNNYRLAVEQTLDKRWGLDGEGNEDEKRSTSMSAASAPSSGTSTATSVGPAQKTPDTAENGSGSEQDDSAYYFESYAHNDIHETMLKDTIRTCAYRDFIYANKNLFRGKTVLDIGCGTGILSLFCARAGAARVIAVDNAAPILEKARLNVFHNNLSDVITCIRGRIEDVTLPVDKVDIIVSEWMGYCLLYEAMLPSVLYARDRYLKPGGLLVPSHASMWVAPVADADYVMDNIDFWRDVYGFDMSKAMQADIFRDGRVVTMSPSSICGEPYAFRMLDLHTVKAEDLVFEDKWMSVLHDVSETAGERLDGFLVWFDIFFGESPTEKIDAATTAAEWVKHGRERVAFTTGPFGGETHWRQGLFLIDQEKAEEIEVEKGKKLEGTIEYAVASGHARGLDIRVIWKHDSGKLQSQTWRLH